jgi:hypothetical protein
MSKPGDADQQSPEPVSVTIASDGAEALKSLFGENVPSDTSLAAMGWGIAGAEVTVARSQRRKGGIDIETTAGEWPVASLTISRDRRGLLVCDLWLIHLDENFRDIEQGVSGAHLFARQAESLRGLGVTTIKATAIGDKGAVLVGYYTLPRYGFDGRMSDEQFARLPDSLRRLMGRSRRLLKLFRLHGGPEAWEESGDDIAVSFDLTDGSPSMVAMSKYLAEKVIFR